MSFYILESISKIRLLKDNHYFLIAYFSDDNRLLTLPSGWRIQFGPNVNFIFETHDLSFASPATISRMGMIFLSDEDTDIKNIVYSWISKQEDEKIQNFLQNSVDEVFFKAIDW